MVQRFNFYHKVTLRLSLRVTKDFFNSPAGGWVQKLTGNQELEIFGIFAAKTIKPFNVSEAMKALVENCVKNDFN